MKKKIIIFSGIMVILFCMITQFLNAQTCSGDEVLMSKGCACGYKKNQCQSKCVKPDQVQHLLKQGWYFGTCSYDCCHWIKIKTKADSISVAEVSSTKSVVSKCNCNCSLPNYGLSKSQLKDCLSYCYRFCEIGW